MALWIPCRRRTTRISVEVSMSHLRLAPLAAAIGVLLIAHSTAAQQEKPARTIRLDDGISVPIAPLWQFRALKGSTKLELTVAEGPLLRMAVYFTVEKRRSASDALQRAAEIVGPPAPEDRRFLINGWPAVEATRLIPVPERTRDAAEEEKPEREQPPRATFERRYVISSSPGPPWRVPCAETTTASTSTSRSSPP